MSLTTEVFGPPGPSHYWVYYIITKSQDVETALKGTETNPAVPVVLMFWANSNEPCRVMLQPFRAMALAKRKEAVFCRVDVDKCKDIAERYEVEALPTFLLIKQRMEKNRVVGPKVVELNTTIKDNI